ncbi:hypothetical protein B0H17DRAFT_1028937 [Mycena rosella]|uniref:Uncharacterized protein n=1 Tax=Mycena rosella TaxID=1033263 RepID=A0AAD7H1G2_MYCRO|nr:hypothetical protein B0H17DRAFT_1028937 [Mycena rosella]
MDLTYSYLHMSSYDFQVIDTLESADYCKGELTTNELKIPAQMVPPDPNDSDTLPSQTHPSYPYGNPTSVQHPASRPRLPYDPSSRALFEDMGYDGGGVNGALRWKDLAMEQLLPVDEEQEEARRAIQARKMASGAASNATAPQVGVQDDGEEDDDEDENDENEEDDDDDDSEATTEGYEDL